MRKNNNLNRFLTILLSSLLVLVLCADQVMGEENPQLVGQLEKLSTKVDQLKMALDQARRNQVVSSEQRDMGNANMKDKGGMKMDMQGMRNMKMMGRDGMNKKDMDDMNMKDKGGMKMDMQGMGNMKMMSRDGMNKKDMDDMNMKDKGGMKMDMQGMGNMKMMGRDGMNKKDMDDMNMKDKGGMKMDMQGMGNMKMMGMMGQMAQKGLAQSSLPGYPGLSHLYHIGATDLFLDHGDQIQLSIDQKTRLYKTKEKTLLDNDSFDRKIEQAEQDLWTLTGSDKPDSQKIAAKIREIEKLRGDKRIAFIRAVGQSTQILTNEQRRLLVGFSPEAEHNAQSEGDNKE